MRRKTGSKQTNEFPHYKIQHWDEFSICWVNLRKSFPDPQKAEDFVRIVGKRYRIGNKYRVIEVTKGGEKIIKTSE